MVLITVFAFIAIPETSAYNQCKLHYHAQNVSQQSSSSEYQPIQANFICFIEGVDSHSGFIAALATIVIAFFTATLSAATKGMLRVSGEQSKAMERSISEATRSAEAMEKVAESIAISSRAATESVNTTKEISGRQQVAMEMQMRAYLTVVIGTGYYQIRKNNVKFGAEPLIINTGHTPAHDVKFRINSEILPFPQPPNFEFSIPQEIKGGSIIGPHQNATTLCVVKDFENDAEVENIRILNGKGLYVWGMVEYKDVFERKRETEFAQIIYWILDGTPHGTVKGLYVPGHNKAT